MERPTKSTDVSKTVPVESSDSSQTSKPAADGGLRVRSLAELMGIDESNIITTEVTPREVLQQSSSTSAMYLEEIFSTADCTALPGGIPQETPLHRKSQRKIKFSWPRLSQMSKSTKSSEVSKTVPVESSDSSQTSKPAADGGLRVRSLAELTQSKRKATFDATTPKDSENLDDVVLLSDDDECETSDTIQWPLDSTETAVPVCEQTALSGTVQVYSSDVQQTDTSVVDLDLEQTADCEVSGTVQVYSSDVQQTDTSAVDLNLELTESCEVFETVEVDNSDIQRTASSAVDLDLELTESCEVNETVEVDNLDLQQESPSAIELLPSPVAVMETEQPEIRTPETVGPGKRLEQSSSTAMETVQSNNRIPESSPRKGRKHCSSTVMETEEPEIRTPETVSPRKRLKQSLSTFMETVQRNKRTLERSPHKGRKQSSSTAGDAGSGRGGVGRGVPRPGPSSIDDLVIRDVLVLPQGQGLETPLHPKRRRFWRSSEQTSSRASQAPVLQEVPAPSPAMFVSKSAVPSPSSVGVPSPAAVPSPASYMECDTRGNVALGRRRHLPPLAGRRLEDGGDAILNYGSEVDEEEEDPLDADDEFPPYEFVSRVTQAMQDTPTEDDANLADVLPHFSMRAESSAPAGMEHLLDLLDPPTPTPADRAPTPPVSTPPAAETLEPRDLYHFDWKAFPEAPVDPTLRREPFTQLNVGPTIRLTDPYEIFISVWDRQTMEKIVNETNRYAQQKASAMMEKGTLKPESRICRWKDIDVDELYVYFGIVLAMGSVIKGCVEDYWSTNAGILGTPGFAAYMSYNRYHLISSCLHFRNNDDMCTAELSYSEAKLFKIDPILKHLNRVFQGNYILSQNLSLDESLLLWKGRLDINVLIPNKAAKVGIKSYEVCESQTGYLWRFEIHTHSAGSVQQQLGDTLTSSTPAIVLRLINGLENKGYTLWMDNFYNSPALARHLKSIGVDCVGTLRTNRMFVPQALHTLTKFQMRPGQLTGVTSGDVDVMVWRDANRVAMISTYHGNAVATSFESTKPILILDYNIAMGGVDKKDQMLASYPVERKRSQVWYKKLFKRLLNVSVHNSYIIHKHNTGTTNTITLTNKTFRKHLLQTLLEKHSTRTQHTHSTTSIQLPAPTQNVSVPAHRLSEYPVSGAQRLRSKCAVCRKRVKTFCVGCNKAMCLAGDCFVTAHTPQ